MTNDDTKRIFETADPELLLKEIRCELDGQHRLYAAEGLQSFIDEPQVKPHLINMALYDPDPAVRQAIEDYLRGIFGSEVKTILSVEGADGEPVETPWMLPCQLEKLKKRRNEAGVGVDAQTESLAQMGSLSEAPTAEVQGMIDQQDFEGLEELLRDPYDPARRMQAVMALNRLQGDTATRLLAQSVLRDPEAEVGQSAYVLLYQSLGPEATEDLLESVGQEESEEDWLLPIDPYSEETPVERNDSIFGLTKTDHLRGMVLLFDHEEKIEKKLLILRQIVKTSSVRLNEFLAGLVLDAEQDQIREFAENELKTRFGDSADEFIASFEAARSAEEGDTEIEEKPEEEIEQIESSYPRTQEAFPQSSVISEGSSPNWLLIAFGLVVVALIAFLVFR